MTRSAFFCVTALLATCVFGQETSLVPGTPIEREIQADQVHAYRLPVLQGQFVHVKVAQLGSDVEIRLIQPDGKKFSAVDRLPYEGYEDLPWIATTAGDCIIEIHATKKSKSGSYRAEISIRAPSEQDKSRVAAYIASWIEGTALLSEQTAAPMREADAKFQFAVAEWRKAGDRNWEAYALTERGRTLQQLGQYAKAREVLEEGLTIRRALDERFSLSISLNG